ncbi:MAG TPA: TetR/AcrR family transcriptional regulator [Leptolyngbyaceae cyanobacterium]
MPSNKSHSILDISQQLTQTRGYNAFSYADISARVNIRKASIHYYFPSKEDLGRKLVIRYRRLMRERLQAIEQASSTAHERLSHLARFYRGGLSEDSLCLCTMLSAEFLTLPESVQSQVQEFWAELEDWVAQVIQTGQEASELQQKTSARTAAQGFLAGLQGAQMMCRMETDRVDRWDAIASHLIDQLKAS